MPNVQKLKAKERLEAIDTEVKDLIVKQETRLGEINEIDPAGEGATEKRNAKLAEVKDANSKLAKLKDERADLEAIVAAEEQVEAENRAKLGQRAPKNPKKGEEQKAFEAFSWHRFIECSLDGKFDGAEKDVVGMGHEEAESMHRSVAGDAHPLPTAFTRVMGIAEDGKRRNLNIVTKDQTAGTNSEGGFMIETQLGDVIPALTPRSRVLGMGVKFFPGLSGNLAWPRETNVITGASVAESTAAAESSIVFDQVTLTPKRIAHFTEFTRDLMHRGKQAINVLVPDRLNRGLGIEWDRQLIEGSGASNELLGALNMSGINVVAIGTNGGALTWNHILQLEELIAMDNADVGEIRGLTNPKVRRSMKETVKESGQAKYLWDENSDTANSYPFEVTTQVPYDLTKGTGTDLSAIIQAYWPGLMVGHWGTDIVVNPYSLDKEAMVRVSAHLWTDVDVEHPEMIAAIKDIDTT